MSDIRYIHELLERHYHEAAEGLVDKVPSRLSRGEGTEKNFYILKIDLVGSTQMLLGRKKGTYLKLAHTFLSSIDKITENCGADSAQTEYAGDSVLAYFPENVTAEEVMRAASCSRAAVLGIKRLDVTLQSLQLKCKVVLHFDTLLVSKIGPRANSFITAIGYPLHRVAKLEKEIAADTGRATEKFFEKVTRGNKKYLFPVYEEKQIQVPSASQQVVNSLDTSLGSLSGLLNFSPADPKNTLHTIIRSLPPPTPQFRIEKNLIGYNLIWPLLFHDLGLSQI